MGGEGISSSASLQRKLEWPRGMVEFLGPLPGECFRNQATKHIARGDARYAPICYAQGGEASHSECFTHVCRHASLREECGSFCQQLNGLAILKQKFQVFRAHARKAGCASSIDVRSAARRRQLAW